MCVHTDTRVQEKISPSSFLNLLMLSIHVRMLGKNLWRILAFLIARGKKSRRVRSNISRELAFFPANIIFLESNPLEIGTAILQQG
jgi:hypothetical protein